MRHQQSTSVVSVPIARAEAWLADPENWPSFLTGVRAVRRTGYERYRFSVEDGRHRRDVVVCVRHLHAVHRFVWRALEGPGYSGLIELREVDARHTVVRLALTAHPGSLLAGVAEMLLPWQDRASHDLRQLAERIGRPAG